MFSGLTGVYENLKPFLHWTEWTYYRKVFGVEHGTHLDLWHVLTSPALIFNTFVNRTGVGKCQMLIHFKDLEHHLTLFVVQLYHVISPIVEWCSTRTSTPQENGLCYSCAQAGFALWPLIIAFVPWRWHTEAKGGVTASALNQVGMGQLWNCQIFGE